MSDEEEIEKMLDDMRKWIAEQPLRVLPEDMALQFFAERLSICERRAFLLGCASRVACFVDPGISAVQELSLGSASAFSAEVDHLFAKLLKSEELGNVALLERYAALLESGVLGRAYGGQGDSLVEELLDPAMSLLKCILSEDGLNGIFRTEDGDDIRCAGYHFSRDVCRMANGMIDPDKFPESDVGGIPPWVLESVELDAQWSTIRMLSHLRADRMSLIETAEHYSRKCRNQNLRLAQNGLAQFNQKLLDSWRRSD